MLGHMLRSLRHRRGMTQTSVAGRLGTSQVTLSRWERGATVPHTQRLAELLQVLNATPEERRRVIEACLTMESDSADPGTVVGIPEARC